MNYCLDLQSIIISITLSMNSYELLFRFTINNNKHYIVNE